MDCVCVYVINAPLCQRMHRNLFKHFVFFFSQKNEIQCKHVLFRRSHARKIEWQVGRVGFFVVVVAANRVTGNTLALQPQVLTVLRDPA